MSELSILELETEHAELLPEREALAVIIGHHIGGGNTVFLKQTAVAITHSATDPVATASNDAFIVVG